MKRFVIKSDLKKVLRSASRAKIEDYFVNHSVPERERCWLPSDNRYRLECTSLFEKEVKRAIKNNKPLSKQKRKALCAYVGASAPTHAMDGWSFLGRAVESALRGDTYSAVHFAYYAELRAAMALLASEGIGIFSGRHVAIGDKAEYFLEGRNVGTHRIVWPVLKYWSGLTRAVDLFDQILKPGDLRLSAWLTPPMTGTVHVASGRTITPVSAIAQKWLEKWGLDLANMDEDHASRNLASYRPSEFRRPPPVSAKEVGAFVEELWRMFEPGQGRRFPNLENLLLRRALRYRSTAAITAAELEQIGIARPESNQWSAFLNRTNDPSVITLAEQTSNVDEPYCHLQMISRAALLLFIASSAARNLIASAGYTSATMSFWWKRHGVDRALWNGPDDLDSPFDYWADVLPALTDIADWSVRNKLLTPSLKDLRSTQPALLNELGAFEIVGIWSLIP